MIDVDIAALHVLWTLVDERFADQFAFYSLQALARNSRI